MFVLKGNIKEASARSPLMTAPRGHHLSILLCTCDRCCCCERENIACFWGKSTCWRITSCYGI